MLNASRTTNILVKLALLSAVSVILMYVAFPIIPAFNWLWIDFSDIPALIGALAYGPIYGIIIEGVKIGITLLIRGSITAGIGELANFIIGSVFVATASYVYVKERSRINEVAAMIIATIAMIITAVVVNYFILIPLYRSFVTGLNNNDYVVRYLFLGVVPFNLIKGAAVSLLTLMIYKSVSRLLIDESMSYRKKERS